MTIQRYTLFDQPAEVVEYEGGDYVKFTDHQAQINRIAALVITAANEVDSCGESVMNLHRDVSRRLTHLGSELNQVAQKMRGEVV